MQRAQQGMWGCHEGAAIRQQRPISQSSADATSYHFADDSLRRQAPWQSRERTSRRAHRSRFSRASASGLPDARGMVPRGRRRSNWQGRAGVCRTDRASLRGAAIVIAIDDVASDVRSFRYRIQVVSQREPTLNVQRRGSSGPASLDDHNNAANVSCRATGRSVPNYGTSTALTRPVRECPAEAVLASRSADRPGRASR